MIWSVVVAAGRGSRFGGEVPKQYRTLGGRRVLDWSIERARQAADGTVLVVAPDQVAEEHGVERCVAGGESRSGSVRAGLAAVPEAAEVVIVHDAARPLASAGLFEAVVDAVRSGADGAIPGVAVRDTLKRVEFGVVTETLDRATLVAVQTPQAFVAPVLRRAHGSGDEATDDAALVERIGGRIVVVEGEATNLKITDAHDLAVAEACLR